jgi:DNA-binding response OmpR family regulator
MTTQDTILIVDDEEPVRQVIGTLLETEGFKVLEAADGKSCLKIVYDSHPNLVLLDILMPGRDGREVCRLLRDMSADIPIIMLTALSGAQETVERLKDGADDYLAKPFHNEELVARIRAVLRRTRQIPASRTHTYQDSVIQIDFDAHQLGVNGEPVSLSPKQWRLLECLVAHKDRAVMREELLRFAWGTGFEHEPKYLKVFISHLRQKLNDDPKDPCYIHTIREQGYLFQSHT